MNIFEEFKIRIKYKDEMELWDYELRRQSIEALEIRFGRREGMPVNEFLKIHDMLYPISEPGRIREIERRVAIKSKINVR